MKCTKLRAKKVRNFSRPAHEREDRRLKAIYIRNVFKINPLWWLGVVEFKNDTNRTLI